MTVHLESDVEVVNELLTRTKEVAALNALIRAGLAAARGDGTAGET